MKRRRFVFIVIFGVVTMLLANCGVAVTTALTATLCDLVLPTPRASGVGVTAPPTPTIPHPELVLPTPETRGGVPVMSAPTATHHKLVLPTSGATGDSVTFTPAPTTPQPSDSGVGSASFNVTTSGGSTLEWTHLSSKNGDLPAPGEATQQTASLILDVDKDGVNDFVIGSRRGSPAMVW